MLYDIAIIGAGPCGLAVAARLFEQTPSALFTEDEHIRYWRRFHHKPTLESELRNRRKGSNDNRSYSEKLNSKPSIVVLDANSSTWLDVWKSRFTNLNISHLRSPLFFHPDPRDRDSLLAFAHEEERTKELIEIPNVVGKEISKHMQKRDRKTCKKNKLKVERHLRIDGRDRIDYFTPSTELFEDHCTRVMERYELQNIVQQAEVRNITYSDTPEPSGWRYFTLDTTAGTYLSRIVVVAVGSGMLKPEVPLEYVPCIRAPLSHGSVCHCFAHSALEVPMHIRQKLSLGKTTTIVIIGGGLTAAQIAHLFITKHNISKVYILVRGEYRVKPFDVDLEWVSKTRNQQMSRFWSADSDEERLEMLRTAKNGGSVSPVFDRLIKKHVASGRLIIHTHTRLSEGSWNQDRMIYRIKTQPPVDQLEGIDVDHLIFATGLKLGVNEVDFLKDLSHEFAIETLGGLPKINEDLMWNEQVPLFLTGALAALRLGPGAANLAGARLGAERVAWKIEEILGSKGSAHKPPADGIHAEDFWTEVDGFQLNRSVDDFYNKFETLGLASS